MRKRLATRLAYLASDSLQIRYIVHGTKNEYLVPEEVLDMALSHAETVLSRAEFKAQFSKAELSALRLLIEEIGRREIPLADQDLNTEELIRRNEAWAAVREAAKHCLQVMKFDLEAWEQSEFKDA